MSMRICIFSLDDSYPVIDEEKVYFLNQLKKCVDQLIIVCNVGYESCELKKLLNISKEVYMNITGYDANRWKYGIRMLNISEKLEQIQELVLVNDSFFGPLFPLDIVFSKMQEKKVDFWGLTVHGKMPGKKTFLHKKKCWNRFLQTYFLCFNKNVLVDNSFLNFWEGLPCFHDFEEYEEKFEFVLTDYFGKQFKWDSYVDTSMWESEEVNNFVSFILFQPYELIKQKNLPILSKYALTIDKKVQLNFHSGEQISNALNYIDKFTEYDVNLIYSYLIKRFNLYDLKQALNLNLVIPYKNKVEQIKNSRVAIFAHLYYEEMFDYCLAYLVPLSEYIDIYITTGSEKSKETIEAKLTGVNIKKVEICTYRGREWAAYLLIDKKYIFDYDYCCLIHDKKSAHMSYRTVGKSFCDILWDNSLKDLEYVNEIIDFFDQNESVGLLVPPEVYHSSYFYVFIDSWTTCFEGTKKILEDLKIYVPLDIEKPPVSLGSVFWCRCSAIYKLFEMNIDEKDFPEEPLPIDGSFNHCLERVVPYIVQDSGYYTYSVMTTDYARINLANYQEISRQILKLLKEYPQTNLITFQECLKSIKKE